MAGSAFMLGLTGAIEAVTWLAFVLVMVPHLLWRPVSSIACVTCASAAFYLHYKCVCCCDI